MMGKLLSVGSQVDTGEITVVTNQIGVRPKVRASWLLGRAILRSSISWAAYMLATPTLALRRGM